jgi:hypothetical protein
MIKNRYLELNKIKLVTYVDTTLDKTLTKDNINSKFKGISIWLLNLGAMNEKLFA